MRRREEWLGDELLDKNKGKRGKWGVKVGRREKRIFQGKGSVGGIVEKIQEGR